MIFDARSLFIVGGLLCCILAASIEFQAVRPAGRRTTPDFWTLGLLIQAAGLVLLSQRGRIPDLWSIAVANSLLLSGLLFFYTALQKVRGVAPNRMLLAAMPLGLAVVLPVVGFAPEAFPTRVLMVMSAWLFGFALSCWAAFQIARIGYVAGASLILAPCAVVALFAVGYGLAVADREIPGALGSSGPQLAFYAIHDICITLITFGYMDIIRVARDQLRHVEGATQLDALTGLSSGPAFMKMSLGELQRARRRGYPVCVMAIQIDGFETVKTLRGEAFAEAALKRVAGIIQAQVRIYDVAGRAHSSVIGVVMPELPLDEGLEVAERIRLKVAGDPSIEAEPPPIHISIGLCEAQTTEHDTTRSLALAEACLERAQAGGGNRIVTPAAPG